MLKQIRHLDYVVLLCRDMARMKQFYQDVMGFPIYREWESGTWIELRVGSVVLALRPRGRPYDGDLPENTAGLQLAFRVTPDEVYGCYEELKAKQVEILDPPTDRDFGHRTLFFKDPEGNVLEIYADIPVKRG